MKNRIPVFHNNQEMLNSTFTGFVSVAALFGFIVIFLASCSNNTGSNADVTVSTVDQKADTASVNTNDMKPSGPKPAWAPDMTAEMQVVIEKLASYGTPPLTSLSAEEARKTPSPADAAMAVMKEHNIPMPKPNVDTTGTDISVAGGQIHLRIYTPKTNKDAYPVIVYYHGGGWVIANLDTYDASANALAEQVDAIVVSVAYRQAPEFKFPVAHNDSYAAYEWALKNAASIKGNPKLVVVAGESAGGNLAASVSMMARDKKVQMPLHQLLVYPIAGYDMNTESYKKYDTAKPLSKPLMSWFFDKYLPDPTAAGKPWISLVKANLKGMPPTTIVAAEIDPLQSEGQLLADKLKDAGVSVTYQKYNGVTHEFFGMAAVIPEAKQAQAFAAGELKKAVSQ